MKNKTFGLILLSFLITSCLTETPIPEIEYLNIPVTEESLSENQIDEGENKVSEESIQIDTKQPTTSPDSYSQILYSPDEKYVAKLYYGSGPSTPSMIEVSETTGEKTLVIPTKFEHHVGDPHPSLKIYGWSIDSSVLYFYYTHFPDGGEYSFWWDGFDLQSFDISTGTIQNVIPDENQEMLAFAFSFDGAKLAYTRSSENPYAIHILDLDTVEDKKANVVQGDLDYIRVGNIFWSPSGTRLAFQTEDVDYWTQTIYLDTESMEMEIIYEYRLTANLLEGWASDDALMFINNNENFEINVNTKESKIISTATPYAP